MITMFAVILSAMRRQAVDEIILLIRSRSCFDRVCRFNLRGGHGELVFLRVASVLGFFPGTWIHALVVPV